MWYKLFIAVVNRHAPIRHKRVKHSKLPPWLNKNIIQVMSDRDRLKKERMFTEYKTARNEVENLVRNANKLYFRRPTLDEEIPHNFTASAFNDYFLSIAETLIKSQDSPDSNKHYSCTKALLISVSNRQRKLLRLPYP